MMAKKCTKKRDACAKLLFYQSKHISLLPFLMPLPSSLLKLPIMIGALQLHKKY